MNAYQHFCTAACAEHRRRRLYTDREFQAAQRAWDRVGMDDPTLDAPELTDADDPSFGIDDAPAAVNFPPLSCRCGSMVIQGVDAAALTREWAAMDRRDHHLGRPCGTKLWSI